MEQESVLYFREKAAQCRRLAALIANQNDPAVRRLEELANEFDAKASGVPGDNSEYNEPANGAAETVRVSK